jgi:adenosylcobinamide kinase / adenosylcobinamide-phosphate guanylyltransferase
MVRGGERRITLVLGGARSGKSDHAEALARTTGLPRVYIATAEPSDDEMAARIARHRADRAGDGWTTIEAPLDLAGAMARESRPGRIVLADCLTIWLSNTMLAGRDPSDAQEALLATLTAATGPVVLVSNEVGLGLVPGTPLGRRFRDAQGRLNQAVARLADEVVFVAAGLPLLLKPAKD